MPAKRTTTRRPAPRCECGNRLRKWASGSYCCLRCVRFVPAASPEPTPPSSAMLPLLRTSAKWPDAA
jgi:hypothetical protein